MPQALRLSSSIDLAEVRDLVNPPAVRRRTTLSAPAKEVAFALWRLAGYRYGLLNTSFEQIGAETGRTADAVRRQVLMLVDRGLFTELRTRRDGTLDLAIDDLGPYGWIDPQEKDRPLLRIDAVEFDDVTIARPDVPAGLGDLINPPHVRRSNLGALAKQCYYLLWFACGCQPDVASVRVADLLAELGRADRKSFASAVQSLGRQRYLEPLGRPARGFIELRVPDGANRLRRVDAPADEQLDLLATPPARVCGFPPEENHKLGPAFDDERCGRVADAVRNRVHPESFDWWFAQGLRFDVVDEAFVVTAWQESICGLLRNRYLWPHLRPLVTAEFNAATPIRFRVDPSLDPRPKVENHKRPLKYLSTLSASEISRSEISEAEALKGAVCGFPREENHKPLAERVATRAVNIRVRLCAHQWFYHWPALQAALAVETGRLAAEQLDELLSTCATTADSPYAMFTKRAPALFNRRDLTWLDAQDFKAEASGQLEWDEAWDARPWPETYAPDLPDPKTRGPPRPRSK